MNLKLSKAISVFVCLLAAAFSQSSPRLSASPAPRAKTVAAQQQPLVVYTTPPKTFAAKLKAGDTEADDIRIKVTFTIAMANYDDTMVGTLVFTIPEEARKKVAEVACKPLSSIPTSVARKDVVAGFRKGTSCPTVGIDIGAMELEVAGAILSFKHIVVDVIENPQEVPQHFCFWTRLINANRPRRGVIASLNRLITAEP